MRSHDHVRSIRNAAVIALAFVALPASGTAAQQRVPWVVAESHGDVTQQTADGALPVALGATLAEGAPVRTGADGTLLLAHGNDRVTVSANSTFAIPVGVDPAAGPSLLQTLGTLLFKVEHTPGRRFEVDTPYLAAVVKGTVFTVSINGAAQLVHVAEGAVEVTSSASHDAVLVRPGQTATVSSPNAAPSVIDGHSPAGTPGSQSEGEDAPRDSRQSQATQMPASPVPGAVADGRGLLLTQTLGNQPLDVAALTNGLLKAGTNAAAVTPSPNPAAAASPSVSVSAGAPTETPSTVSAPAVSVSVTPGVAVNVTTPGVSVTVPVSAPNVAGVVPLVDPVIGAAHGAAPTAKLLGANNPVLTVRKP